MHIYIYRRYQTDRVPGSLTLPQLAADGHRRLWTASASPRRPQTATGSHRRLQAALDSPRQPRTTPDGPRRRQAALDSPSLGLAAGCLARRLAKPSGRRWPRTPLGQRPWQQPLVTTGRPSPRTAADGHQVGLMRPQTSGWSPRTATDVTRTVSSWQVASVGPGRARGASRP